MDFAHHTSLAIASRDGAGLLEEFDSDNDGSLSLEEHLKAYDSDGEDLSTHFSDIFGTIGFGWVVATWQLENGHTKNFDSWRMHLYKII